jgi:hypothetical protein
MSCSVDMLRNAKCVEDTVKHFRDEPAANANAAVEPATNVEFESEGEGDEGEREGGSEEEDEPASNAAVEPATNDEMESKGESDEGESEGESDEGEREGESEEEDEPASNAAVELATNDEIESEGESDVGESDEGEREGESEEEDEPAPNAAVELATNDEMDAAVEPATNATVEPATNDEMESDGTDAVARAGTIGILEVSAAFNKVLSGIADAQPAYLETAVAISLFAGALGSLLRAFHTEELKKKSAGAVPPDGGENPFNQANLDSHAVETKFFVEQQKQFEKAPISIDGTMCVLCLGPLFTPNRQTQPRRTIKLLHRPHNPPPVP